jgi:hypothetical protein
MEQKFLKSAANQETFALTLGLKYGIGWKKDYLIVDELELLMGSEIDT